MSSINSAKGSQWRRWDLHIHPPKTKLSNAYRCEGDEWDEYIEILENSSVHAFGITDYFCVDGYFKLIEEYKRKYPETKKIFFPNIEFRLVEAISADSKNPHIHVLFDNDVIVCSKPLIDRFLSTLKTQGENDTGTKISCAELQTTEQYEAASVTIEDLRTSLKDTFGEVEPYLIAFPAKNDGVKSTDSSSPRKVVITDKIDNASHLFFGDSGNRDWFLRSDRYENGTSDPKPVVSGSDAHSFADLERLEGNVSGFEPTWIKADLTFRGLKQICFEPISRIHIGLEPEVEIRKARQATKFLARLQINQCESYSGSNGQWFKNVDIQINPELVVIIGNKGSGKSSLVDIIGLLGNSRQEDHFSFLSNKTNNKKFKQRGYAENFTAKIIWHSGTPYSKGLDTEVDKNSPETVRYLPQNYFEKLTNEIEIEVFRKEIEDVVFSHVDKTNRLGMESFEKLQELKTQQSKEETSLQITALQDLNLEIIELEDQAAPEYKIKLEGELQAKNAELTSLVSAKPTEVPKPEEQTETQRELTQKIEESDGNVIQLRSTRIENLYKLTESKSREQKLSSLLQKVTNLKMYVKKQVFVIKIDCDDLELDLKEIISTKIDVSPINDQKNRVILEIKMLEKDNQIDFEKDVFIEDLQSLPDLEAAIKHTSNEIITLKEQLGAPQRKYQTYLEKLAQWEADQKEITGDRSAPKVGTIELLKSKMLYLNKTLPLDIQKAHGLRKELVKEIFDSKNEILSFYSDLKQSVEAKLSSVNTEEFAVAIDAFFIVERKFQEKFLNFLNKTKKGFFHGANNPIAQLKSLISEVDWNDFNSIYAFFDEVIEKMSLYKGESILIRDQTVDISEFYNFIFSLDYCDAKYELQLGGKNLNELSPGEKGLLLMVFYLQLDRDNIPLIIDQPEDNLDNDSIFAILAPCIRGAKKKRQVILVTHNPNLAIGADAEQVIYVNLDKANNYKFIYETGSIENPRINKRIIDILEGSQPAFVKRRLKYQI